MEIKKELKMSNKTERAAKTVMSLCLDFLQHKITDRLFVNNLKMFANLMEQELSAEPKEKV